MARGELMKKLLASYGRDDEFRAVAEQIVGEEEKKNNRALARSLRRALDTGGTTSVPANTKPSPKALAPLLPFPNAAAEFVELVTPTHTKHDIVLSAANVGLLLGLIREFRRAAKFVDTAYQFDRSFSSAGRPVAARPCARRCSRPNSDFRFMQSK